MVVRMSRCSQVLVNPLSDRRIHRDREVLAALPDEVEAPVPLVLVEVLHRESCNFRAARSNLEPDGKNRTVAKRAHVRGEFAFRLGVFDELRGIEEGSSLLLREALRLASPSVHSRASNLANRVDVGQAPADQVGEEARERGETAPDGSRSRRRLFLFHLPNPRDDGRAVDQAQVIARTHSKCGDEVCDVGLVGSASLGASLTLKPKVLFGNLPEDLKCRWQNSRSRSCELVPRALAWGLGRRALEAKLAEFRANARVRRRVIESAPAVCRGDGLDDGDELGRGSSVSNAVAQEVNEGGPVGRQRSVAMLSAPNLEELPRVVPHGPHPTLLVRDNPNSHELGRVATLRYAAQ